jgi:hypothetical protein
MVVVLACVTILSSLHADYVATNNLFSRYGPEYEANPIIRLVGPRVYFGALFVASLAVCRAEKRGETWPAVLALVTWSIQTWAVSTHEPLGTVREYPLLYLRITW